MDIAVPLAPILLERRYRLLVDALWRLGRSRPGQWALAAGSGAIVVVLALLAARHFASTSWPLASGNPGLLVAAGLLLLLAQALKAYGWGRLFVPDERPKAARARSRQRRRRAGRTGPPGPLRRRDADRGRTALPRLPGRCARALPLARDARPDRRRRPGAARVRRRALPGAGLGVRAALGLVALGGVAAAAVIVALPRLVASRRALRFRLGRWLSPRMTSRPASQAWALVSACWLVRALAVFVLLGTLGVGFSFPLALLFLCAGAAAAALPVGLAGAATQVGVGGAALIASGVGASQALSVAVSVAALGVLSGGAILLFAVVWRTGVSLTLRATTP